jgi:DNA replication and repair protein RecF
MQLSSLSVDNFKNIADMELYPSPKLTCFTGCNGMGKTNVLDAIYMLSMCKSSAGLPDRECIRHDEDFFLIKGTYNRLDLTEIISYGVKKQGVKVIKRNDKAYKRIGEHLGLLPLVMVSPADSGLVADSSELRRRYLNGLLVQTDSRYFSLLARYTAALAQRNKLLKNYMPAHADVLYAIDMQLAQYGQEIYEFRKRIVEMLKEPFTRCCQAISADIQCASIGYVSDLHTDTLANLLKLRRGKDMALQHTTVGIHRDDLELKQGNYSVRRIGSQGQQKTILLALKLAQSDVLKNALGIAPILLLDDIFDKLDSNRIQNLMCLLANDNYGQIFLSDSSKERLNVLLHALPYDNKLVEINNGQII